MSTARLLGTTTQGTGNNGAGNAYAQRFQCLASGIVSAVSTYCRANSNVRIAIYADSSGSMGSLLAESNSAAVTATAWQEIALNSNVNVTKDAYYWLAVQNETSGGASWSSGGSYNYKVHSYGAFPSGSGWTTTTGCLLALQGMGILTLSPSGTAGAEAFGALKINLKIALAGIASLEAFGSPCVQTAGIYLIPAGIAPLDALGTPAVINRQLIYPDGPAPTLTFGLPAVTLRLQIIVPGGIAGVGAFGTPGLYQGNITCAGILPGLVFGTPRVIRYPAHIILEAAYRVESPGANRIFVVGRDSEGSAVTGSAITQADVDLVGERLEVQNDPALATASAAEDAAEAVLSRARLDGRTGRIIIPPHCGVELWDIISVADAAANQSACYRITAYTLEYDVKEGRYLHHLELSEV